MTRFFPKNSFRWLALGGVLALAVFLAVGAYAASEKDIKFPVAELGGCKNEVQCRAYCEERDNPAHVKACVAFAKKYNLLSAEEAAEVERFSDVIDRGGPGGCRNEKACVDYCDDNAHLDECLSFAEQHQVISPKDLAEAKKVLAALKAGGGLPGNCKNKQACEAYCQNPKHAEECVDFAEKAGFISADEAAEARKFAPYIARGETPGRCSTKQRCEDYCGKPEHIEECIDFGEKAGLMSPTELAEAKKVLPFLKSGETPGNCRSKAACESYCDKDEHAEECVNFAIKAGFIGEEEAAFLRKTGFKGPGNCKSKEKCEDFCNDPNNQKTCLEFAVKGGFLTTEEIAQFGDPAEFKACLPFADEKLVACFKDNMGEELFEQMKVGRMRMEIGKMDEMLARVRKSRQCVDNYSSQSTHQITNNPDALKCLAGELGDEIVKKIKAGNLACGEIGQVQEKLAKCVQATMKEKLKICIAVPCDETFSCLENFKRETGGGGKEGEGGQQTMDPEFEARMQACSKEKINDCLTRSCSEFMSCINKLQEGQPKGSESKGGGQTDPAVEAKVKSCVPKGGGGGGGGKVGPIEDTRQYEPSPEQYQKPSQQYPKSGEFKQPQIPQVPQASEYPEQPSPPQLQAPQKIPKVDCSAYASAPSCSYVGAPDSDAYKYCKQCYPDR